MKKQLLTKILLAFIFLAGFTVLLYPTVSNYINKRNAYEYINTYDEAVKKLSREKLLEEKELAAKHNKNLIDSRVILTDPFDESAFKKITDDAGYKKLLSVSESMAYIEIPKINVKLPIYHGTSEATLEKGIGHLMFTSLPVGGIGTHTVVSGHTGLPSAQLFTHLDKLVKGDIFFIYCLDEKMMYTVESIDIVNPDDVSKLKIDINKDLFTLITCTPYGKNTHRLLVQGVRTPIIDEEAQNAQSEEIKGFYLLLETLNMTTASFLILVFTFIIMLGGLIYYVVIKRKSPSPGKENQRK